MQFLVMGWLVLELTSSSSLLGLVIFLYGAPNFGMLLFGGLIADRLDRRKLLMTTQAAAGVVVLLLAAAVFTDRVEMSYVYVTAFVLGIFQGLEMPGRMAIVADLVPRDDIMNAVALNSAVMNTGRIVGPAVAGLVIDLVGLDAAASSTGAATWRASRSCRAYSRGPAYGQTPGHLLSESWSKVSGTSPRRPSSSPS